MIPSIVTITDPKVRRFKTLVWEKNFNNKLSCNGFVHIDFAPRQMPAPAQLEETVFVISNKEDSVTGYFRLLDIKIIRAELTPEGTIAASHGVSAVDFFTAMFAVYPQSFTWKTSLAVYFYLRVVT